MSEEVIDEAALFAQLSTEKGDRLASLHAGTDDTNDDQLVDDGSSDGAKPVTTPAAPAAGPTTTTTSQTAQAPAAAAPAAAAPDIWASATPELRAAHEAALALADQKYRSDIGRQAAHQRRIQVLEQELAASRGKPAAADGTPAPTTTIPAATPAPAAAPARKSLLDDPDVKRSREEYPEAVEPFAKIIESLEGRLDAIDRDNGLSREDRAAQTIAAQEAALDAAHSDWRQACGSREFAQWLEAQPKAIKEIVARNGENVVDAEEAIAMVSSFKAHFALTHPAPQPQPKPGNGAPQPTSLQQRREAQLRAVTKTPAGNGPTPLPDGPSGGADEAVFNHFAAKKAQRK